jgi:glucose/arabinose dehydrogenase
MKKLLTIIVVFIIVVAAGFFISKYDFPARGLQSGEVSDQINDQDGIENKSPLEDLSYHSETISAPGIPDYNLRIPDGYHITVAASGMQKPRFMAMSPDDRVFVPDMVNASDTNNGKIYILDDFNSVTHEFGSKTVYLSDLRNPNSIAFYKDSDGREWIYIALTDKLIRYSYQAGDTKPAGVPQTIATFPDFGNPASEGGWHLTRTIAVREDKLYVSVGSSCDACEETNNERASILEMDPDGGDLHVYASGLRNAVGLEWVDDQLFATAMGVDHLGSEVPNDMVLKIRAGANYGWPYCYYLKGDVLPDTTRKWQDHFDCSTAPQSFTDLPSHSAPLGIAWIDEQAGAALRNSFLVALHGSGNISIGTGNEIIRLSSDGKSLRPIITGFVEGDKRIGRVAGILEMASGDILITDDQNGLVYDLYQQ